MKEKLVRNWGGSEGRIFLLSIEEVKRLCHWKCRMKTAYRRFKEAELEVRHTKDPNVALVGSMLLPLIFLGETIILPFDYIFQLVVRRGKVE